MSRERPPNLSNMYIVKDKSNQSVSMKAPTRDWLPSFVVKSIHRVNHYIYIIMVFIHDS